MDVFDSSDTPDVIPRPLADSEPLPLSIDEDERRNLPAHDSAPLAAGSNDSLLSSISEYSRNTLSHDHTGYRDPTELPTSVDDVMIPSTQPSRATLGDRLKDDLRSASATVSDRLESTKEGVSDKWNAMTAGSGSRSHRNDRDHSSGTFRDTQYDSRGASDSLSDKFAGMKAAMTSKLHQAESWAGQEKDALQSKVHTFSGGSTSISQPRMDSRGSDLYAPLVSSDDISSLPTSQDDVMIPQREFVTGTSSATSDRGSGSDLGEHLKRDARAFEDKLSAMTSELKASTNERMHELRTSAADAKYKLDDKLSCESDSIAQPHYLQPSDTHPLASSMRDAHLHPGAVSLPTHDNEAYNAVGSGTVHRSAAHQRGLDAAAVIFDNHSHEPKEHSAGILGALSSFNEKLEHGAETLKERVLHGSHTVTKDNERFGGDVPTLIDKNNPTNAAIVQSRLHPSSERAGAQSAQ